ncbi:MAG: CDP-alcohol phosphatidyltransferase family protein, partial [Oscillospiraceae bacterium]
GFCDMFDGRIARAMKNRTDLEKSFGIQIDSLCDLICFAVFPAIMGYSLGGNMVLRLVSSVMIVLGGVIRLGYFNVMELKRQGESQEKMLRYTGLPVTSTALIIPVTFLAYEKIGAALFPAFFQCTLMVLSVLFLLKIRVKKPGLIGLIIMSIVGISIFINYLLKI